MSSPQPPAPKPIAVKQEQRLDLVREFKATPIGHHSPELQELLSRLSSGDVTNKYCLIIVKPHSLWAIGRLSGVRGVPPVVAHNRVFESVEDAEWAVFKLRWAEAGGGPIEEDDL